MVCWRQIAKGVLGWCTRAWIAALGAAVLPALAAGSAAGAPAICGPLHEERAGVVRAPGARELSGLVASRVRPGVLFAHNDSGDAPRIFALRADGAMLGTHRVRGARAVDWEDMAIGPGRDGRPALYLGDVGDNGLTRPAVEIYRVPEPGAGSDGATEPAERLSLRYPDGPRDAETLLVDPRGGDLYLVTKRADGRAEVYRAAAPLPFGGEAALRRVALLHLGPSSAATGGDVSAAGDVVVVRSYGSVFAWGRRPGQSLAAALRRRPCRTRADVVRERQGEAIALLPDGRGFVTVSEGPRSPLRRYTARARPS
jgi:hypothetical protein